MRRAKEELNFIGSQYVSGKIHTQPVTYHCYNIKGNITRFFRSQKILTISKIKESKITILSVRVVNLIFVDT